MKQEAYECLYVLWWLVAVVGTAAACLAVGFPHNLAFIPAVAVWMGIWMTVGFAIDSKTQGRFSEGAFPFGIFGRSKKGS